MDGVGSAGSPTPPASVKQSGFRFLSTRGPEGWWPLRKTPDRRRRLWSLEATSFSRPAAAAPVTGMRSVAPAGAGPTHTHVTGQPMVFPSCIHLGVVTHMCGSELISRLLASEHDPGLCVSVYFPSRYKVAANIDSLHRIDENMCPKERKLQTSTGAF